MQLIDIDVLVFIRSVEQRKHEKQLSRQVSHGCKAFAFSLVQFARAKLS
jgi:hypothetical protein